MYMCSWTCGRRRTLITDHTCTAHSCVSVCVHAHVQLEMWETQDYFQMLTEHAIRGLMLLGTPDPYTVLAGDTETKGPVAKFFCCCFGQDQLSGWEVRELVATGNSL